MITKEYKADCENVKWLGRTVYTDQCLWCAYSGTGAEFEFTGTSADITIEGDSAALVQDNDINYARIGIYVNGLRVVDEQIKYSEHTYHVWQSEKPQKVKVTILKLSETAMSTFAIKNCVVTSETGIVPTSDKDMLVEFVGDSITCGYGVDDEDENHHFSTATEDVTKSYSYQTAQLLDADYSMVSISGYGIISGYCGDGETKLPQQVIVPYYDTIGFSYANWRGMTPQDTRWMFDRREPDVIVINLGTNDASYCGNYQDRRDEYKEQYVMFLQKIRSRNQHSSILCCLGVMGETLCESMEEAVQEYSRLSNDYNITVLHLTDQDPKDGYVADWHPTVVTHTKVSGILAPQIQKLVESYAKPKQPIRHSVNNGQKVIALTFDDGPNTTTTIQVLEKLEKYGVVASFFLVGQNISDNTSRVVRKAYDMGCEIQNHSYSHSNMTKFSIQEIKDEVKVTSTLIKAITGKQPTFFRPPYIAVNAVMLEHIKLPFIAGIGANDWEDTVDARERAKRILEQAEDGDIILLHDMEGNSMTVDALDIIIPKLLEQGYQFVTVSELFSAKNIIPDGVTKKVYTNVLQSEMYYS